MPAIHCHIPIKVCITGRLSDAQLEQLEHALIRAVTARLTQARHALGEHGHAPINEIATTAREPFDQARLADGRYGLPAYDDGGQTVGVPVIGDLEAQLEEMWQSAVDYWREQSTELPAFAERARARRVFLLLGLGPETPFRNADEVDQFIDACLKTADSEDKALQTAEQYIDTDDLLLDEGAAFPDTWAWRVRREFHTSADPAALQRAWEAAERDMREHAAYLSGEVWDRGLPLSKGEAITLNLSDLVARTLNSERAKLPAQDSIVRYTQALLRFERATAHYWLVHGYRHQLDGRIDSIRKGDVIVDRNEYERRRGANRVFRAKLQAFEAAAASNDLRKTLGALLLWDPTKFDRLYFVGWQNAGVRLLRAAIDRIDARIAGTGTIECIWRALVWAEARDYFSAAGQEVIETLKANALKMIGTMVAILVAQAIPGVNVAVDLVLLIEFGVAGVEAAIEVGGALKDAGSAKSVVAMEHASARLASVLVGEAAEIALWAATWGTAKASRALAKWRKVEKFLDTHGRNAQTYDALRKSRADVAEAEKILAKQRERQGVGQPQRQPTQAAQASAPARPAPARSAPEPAPESVPIRTPTGPVRTVAEIERALRNQGLAPRDLRQFAGGAKRLSAAVAKRVERLMAHFTPGEVKKLGEFFAEHRFVLDDATVDVLVDHVPKGQLGEYVRHLEIARVHGQATAPPGWHAERPALEKTTTIHPGRPPRLREIVATPGNEALRANLVKRLGEAPPPGYHAHHIIPEKQFGTGLDWMRERLRKAGSGINEADNGVFLAGSKATANPDLTRLHNSYIHAGRSKEYAYTLTRRLGDLHGAGFLKELRNIGEEMRTGKFKIDEIPHGWKRRWQPGMTAPIEPGFEPGLLEE